MAHPSVALTDFDGSLAAAERLSRIESRYRDPPHAETAPTVQALRGGFCVLAVGSFERFVSESFAEHLGPLAAFPPPVAFGDLPDKLRLQSVFQSLEHATRGPRYGEPKSRAARYPDVVAAARRVVAERIDPRALGRTGGNPNADTVREMFNGLGVPDVFGNTRGDFDALWGKPEASTFVSDKLDEILNARHLVAHTADALSISRANLAEWPRFLRTLATVLDKRLHGYVANVLAGHHPP